MLDQPQQSRLGASSRADSHGKPDGPPDRTGPSRRLCSVNARSARCAVFMAPIGLTGCQPAVLDPQGTVGIAEKMILIDSLAIMLVIVIPTISATLAFAWWFRASNERARYLPDWVFSGRIELIVWSIPLLVIMLLGGVAWIASHDLDPAKPLTSNTPPLEVQAVEVAVHLSEPRRRERQPACGSRRRTHSLLPHVSKCDECFLHTAARQHDLHDERHDNAVEPASGHSWYLLGALEPL